METSSSLSSATSEGNNTLDSVTMARNERKQQGPWEVEVSYGGEVDLHQHLMCCEKNPGHLHFIPIDQFSVGHLPPGCQDSDLVDCVRAMADITVRVSVKYVTEKRPDIFPGSDTPYPCYRSRGKHMMTVGTGWVSEVCKCLHQQRDSRACNVCECQECMNSPAPKTQYAYIYITTATHVVFDDLEAAHTTCHLFFDNGSIPEACSGVVTLTGMSHVRNNIETDQCEMRYITHDLDLADKLEKMVNRCLCLSSEVPTTHDSIRSERRKLNRLSSLWSKYIPWNKLTIVVSHPHGCSKQVSVGNYTTKDRDDCNMIKYTYTASTCPGSSGARVLVTWKEYIAWFYTIVHSGGEGEQYRQLNFSCKGV
uniref:Uncharacterized protein n=1 Tax=Arion vulgaris TaxID=1028688 RepID=A0A0B6Y9A1_9EUPU